MPKVEKVKVKLTVSRTDGARGDTVSVGVAEAARMEDAGQIAAPSKEVAEKIAEHRKALEAEAAAAEPAAGDEGTDADTDAGEGAGDPDAAANATETGAADAGQTKTDAKAAKTKKEG